MFVLVCGGNNTLHNCMPDDANINDLQISIFRRAASFTNPMSKTKWLSETNSNLKYYGKRISDSKLHNLRMTIQFRIDHPKNEKITQIWMNSMLAHGLECAFHSGTNVTNQLLFLSFRFRTYTFSLYVNWVGSSPYHNGNMLGTTTPQRERKYRRLLVFRIDLQVSIELLSSDCDSLSCIFAS